MTPLERFEKKYIPEPNSGCWLWMGVARGLGYGGFRLNPDPTKAMDLAHRVSYQLHCGPIPEGMLVCHRCDNRACVNPDHLFLGSYSDNMQDASRKGRMSWTAPRNLPKGEKHHKAKLTSEQVREIRLSGEEGLSLSRRYGVTNTMITRIRKRKAWRSVI